LSPAGLEAVARWKVERLTTDHRQAPLHPQA
jgi:hypothetical protein